MHCQLLVRLSILNLLWRTNVWCFIFSAGYSVSSKNDSPKNRLVKECLHCGSVDGILFCVWTFAISFQIGRFSSPFFSCYFFGIVSLNSIMFQEMVFELFVIKREKKVQRNDTSMRHCLHRKHFGNILLLRFSLDSFFRTQLAVFFFFDPFSLFWTARLGTNHDTQLRSGPFT
jgi:hypothetical protein